MENSYKVEIINRAINVVKVKKSVIPEILPLSSISELSAKKD
jgi:hypothetical protein